MGESGRSPLAPLKGELSAKLTEGFYAEGTNSACGRGFSCRKANPSVSAAPSQLPFQGSQGCFLKPSRRDTTTVNCTLSTVNSY